MYIIVPYRNRPDHLRQFVKHYNAKLPDVTIVICEQGNDLPFNRGWLLNCGFDFYKNCSSYFAFHDVDMLCNSSNIQYAYSYPEQPRHIATACSQFRYKMPYANYCGGVMLINKQDFIKCNGYSNQYNGWGCEDDDFYKRMINAGLTVEHMPNIRFKSLPHSRKWNQQTYDVNKAHLNNGTTDGLSDLTYNVTVNEKPEYTHLLLTP